MTDSTITRVATLNQIVTIGITTTDRSHHAITIGHATQMIVGNTLTSAMTWSKTIVARTMATKTVTHHGIIAVSGLRGIIADTLTTVVVTIYASIIGDPHKSSLMETFPSPIPYRLEKINQAT